MSNPISDTQELVQGLPSRPDTSLASYAEKNNWTLGSFLNPLNYLWYLQDKHKQNNEYEDAIDRFNLQTQTPETQANLLESAGYNRHYQNASPISSVQGALNDSGEGQIAQGMATGIGALINLASGFLGLRKQSLENQYLSRTLSDRVQGQTFTNAEKAMILSQTLFGITGDKGFGQSLFSYGIDNKSRGPISSLIGQIFPKHGQKSSQKGVSLYEVSPNSPVAQEQEVLLATLGLKKVQSELATWNAKEKEYFVNNILPIMLEQDNAELAIKQAEAKLKSGDEQWQNSSKFAQIINMLMPIIKLIFD